MMKTVIIGEKYRDMLDDSLRKANFEILYLPENRSLLKPLSSHADLSIFLYENCAFLSPNLKNTVFCQVLAKYGINMVYGDFMQRPDYPNDVQLNCSVMGKLLICNEKTICREIKNYFKNNDFNIVHVNQGYTGCSVLKIGENNAITGDIGIYYKLTENGINTLLIDQQFIKLDGFSNGFIGGCGFFSDTALYLTGTLENSNQAEEIQSFILNSGYKIHYLTNKELFDIGKAFVI